MVRLHVALQLPIRKQGSDHRLVWAAVSILAPVPFASRFSDWALFWNWPKLSQYVASFALTSGPIIRDSCQARGEEKGAAYSPHITTHCGVVQRGVLESAPFFIFLHKLRRDIGISLFLFGIWRYITIPADKISSRRILVILLSSKGFRWACSYGNYCCHVFLCISHLLALLIS